MDRCSIATVCLAEMKIIEGLSKIWPGKYPHLMNAYFFIKIQLGLFSFSLKKKVNEKSYLSYILRICFKLYGNESKKRDRKSVTFKLISVVFFF